MSGFIPPQFALLEVVVAKECHVTLKEMNTPGRQQERVTARWVFWYLANKRLAYNAYRIARLKAWDRSTVTHGIDMVENRKELYQIAANVAAKNPGIFERI